jgi:hypothetical protein
VINIYQNAVFHYSISFRLTRNEDGSFANIFKRVIRIRISKIPKGGNQNPYIEEEQTTQWPNEKGQTTIYETYRFGGGSVMIWGVISHAERTDLKVMDGNLNAARYRDEILAPIVLLFRRMGFKSGENAGHGRVRI